jgi:hypothetical protein
LRHVAIYRDWLAGLDARVMGALHQHFAERPFQGTRKQAEEAVALTLLTASGVFTQQRDFDSDTEYARNAQVCTHEIAALGLRELDRLGR